LRKPVSSAIRIPARVADLSGHVPDQPVPDRVLIPDRLVQQPLHPQRRLIPGELRDRPPVRPLQPRHQAQQVRLRAQPRLPAEERRRHHPSEHVIKAIQPASRIHIPYAGRDGRTAIHQDSHMPDDREAAVIVSQRHAGLT
jgi:hypothetical protein